MITCYLSDITERDYEALFVRRTSELDVHDVPWCVCRGTSDIWMRDFMPVRNAEGGLVLFRYDPNYLRSKRYQQLRTDQELVSTWLSNDKFVQSELIVDGGNVIVHDRTAILCDKVWRENSDRTPEAITALLQQLLRVDRFIWLPTPLIRDDPFGHADGLLQIVDATTASANDWNGPNATDVHRKVHRRLVDHGYDVHPMPYVPVDNLLYPDDASGIYINYVVLPEHVLMATYGLPEDDKAVDLVTRLYPNHTIITIDSTDIARNGGVLHCVTWEGNNKPSTS